MLHGGVHGVMLCCQRVKEGEITNIVRQGGSLDTDLYKDILVIFTQVLEHIKG